jgi:hypothetical protein
VLVLNKADLGEGARRGVMLTGIQFLNIIKIYF